MNNHLTIIETAKFLGVSTQTVRRLIQRKTLVGKQSPGPHGLRWEIDRVEVLRYLEAQKTPDQPHQEPQQGGDRVDELEDGSVINVLGELGGNSSLVDHGQQPYQNLDQNQRMGVGVGELRDVAVTVSRPASGGNRLPVDHGQHPDPGVPLAAHLAALQLVGNLQEQLMEARRQTEQAERSKMALEWQMQKYQTALADQAESLAESEAMRRVAEARLEDAGRELQVENLKVALSERRGWGKRLIGWLGISRTG